MKSIFRVLSIMAVTCWRRNVHVQIQLKRLQDNFPPDNFPPDNPISAYNPHSFQSWLQLAYNLRVINRKIGSLFLFLGARFPTPLLVNFSAKDFCFFKENFTLTSFRSFREIYFFIFSLRINISVLSISEHGFFFFLPRHHFKY